MHRVVLDVGCGTGALGAAYRRLNPRARVLGIEMDPGAAAIAAERLDEVAVGDVEADPLPFAPPGGIDCIIYGDVLEHLRDPWAVLERHAEALSDDGTILICVPNVEHWRFAERLLRGAWDYEPSGLLDKGHLRWFSLAAMRKGLEALGLVPCDVHAAVFDREQAAAFANAMAPALRALGVDPQAYAGRAAPLQYVWRVRKRRAHADDDRAPTCWRRSAACRMCGSSIRCVPWRPIPVVHDPDGADAWTLARRRTDTPRIFVLHRPALADPKSRSCCGGCVPAAGWW